MSLPERGDDETVIAKLERGTRREELRALVQLINTVYSEAEDGMWKKDRDYFRTSEEEVMDLVAKGQLVVARLRDKIIGCIQCHMVTKDAGEFGMLVVEPSQRGRGLGTRLIRHAEEHCLGKGARSIHLMLLHPKGWEQRTKEILKKWYPSLGYVKSQEFEDVFKKDYSELASELETECYFTMYKKEL